jgi:hypothetical protein
MTRRNRIKGKRQSKSIIAMKKRYKAYTLAKQMTAKARRDSRHLMNVIQGYNEKLKLIRAGKGNNTSISLPPLES